MKKAWSVVLVVVFVAILLGATAIGVGYLTGADIEQVFTTLENSPAAVFILRLIAYWEKSVSFFSGLPAMIAGLF